MATLLDFENWLDDLRRYGGREGVEVVEYRPVPDIDGERLMRVRIYTDVNCYNITAVERRNGHSYIGCASTCRKPRAGEDWHRGNDLADGSLSRETWQRILADIVSYEMVRVHRAQQSEADAEIPHSVEGPSIELTAEEPAA